MSEELRNNINLGLQGLRDITSSLIDHTFNLQQFYDAYEDGDDEGEEFEEECLLFQDGCRVQQRDIERIIMSFNKLRKGESDE